MGIGCHAFEVAYGRKMPAPMAALYENHELLAMAPVCFSFRDKPFVVEIQYFRAIDELNEQDVKQSRFAFALSSDGFDLVIDLNEHDLPILQREYDDIDRIGVSLSDLLIATHRRCERLGQA